MSAFEKIAKAADEAAKAIAAMKEGKVENRQEDAKGNEESKKPGENAQKNKGFFEKMFDAIKKGWTDTVKAMTIANIAAKAFEWAIGKVKDFITQAVARAWDLNDALDETIDRLTAFASVYTNFGKATAEEQGERSKRIADTVYAKYKDIAYKMGEPLAAVKQLGEDITPMALSAGKSWGQSVAMVENAAKAAKAFQTHSGMAGASIERLLYTASPGRSRDPFTIMLAAEAKLKDSDSMEKRVDKINRALEKMGKGADQFTTGTNEALARFGILADELTQKLGAPFYDKAGEFMQWLADAFYSIKDPVMDVADELGRWLKTAYDFGASIAGVIWKLEKAWLATSGLGKVLKATLDGAWSVLKGFGDTAEAVALAFKTVEESIAVMTGESKGLGKLDTLQDAMYAKLLRFVQKFSDMLTGLFEAAAELHVPGMEAAAKSMRASNNVLRNYIENGGDGLLWGRWAGEKSIDKRERKLGLSHTTEIGRRADEAMADLSKERGDKRPLINIDKVEIKQDFRDQDPDGIVVEFVGALEKLSETAASAVGGPAATHGP